MTRVGAQYVRRVRAQSATKVVALQVTRVEAQSVSKLRAPRVGTQYVTGVRFSQESLILKYTSLSVLVRLGMRPGSWISLGGSGMDARLLMPPWLEWSVAFPHQPPGCRAYSNQAG